MHYMFYKAVVLYSCDGDVEKQDFIIKIKLVNYFGAFLSHLAKLVLYISIIYANINRLRDTFNKTMKKLCNVLKIYKFIQFKRHSETN